MMERKNLLPSHPKGDDERVSPERKDGNADADVARQGLKRPASLIDVSENTTSTNNDSVKVAYSERLRDDDDDGDEDDDDMSPTKLASLSRSERKRYREKKRRSDVNKGFDDLMALLLEIDPEVQSEAEERARRGQWKGAVGTQDENLLSRVDLISRTVTVLRRLHEENEQRKLIIGQLVQESNRNVSLQSGREDIRLPFPAINVGGTEESINRLVAERAQREALLSRLTAQRRLLQGSGFNLVPPTDVLAGGSFNQLAGAQGAAFSNPDILSMLGPSSFLQQSGSLGPTGLGHGVGRGSFGFGGHPNAQAAPGNQHYPVNGPRDYLQQYTSAQLQQLLRDNNNFGSTSNAGRHSGQGN